MNGRWWDGVYQETLNTAQFFAKVVREIFYTWSSRHNMTRATVHALHRKMQRTHETLEFLLVGSVRLRPRLYLERRSRNAAVSLGKWTTRSRLEAV